LKKVILALTLLCAIPLLAAPAAKKAPRKEKSVASPRDYANTLATLQTDMGDITIKFFYDKAPHHRTWTSPRAASTTARCSTG
jgi:hypothetical protein